MSERGTTLLEWAETSAAAAEAELFDFDARPAAVKERRGLSDRARDRRGDGGGWLRAGPPDREARARIARRRAEVAEPRSRSVLAATPSAVASTRRAIGDWLRREGVAPERIGVVQLALSEAVTNVVQHAYRGLPEPGVVDVAAVLSGGELRVAVADSGDGMRPHGDSEGLGLGLEILAKLADAVDLVTPDDGGFEVRMRFRV